MLQIDVNANLCWPGVMVNLNDCIVLRTVIVQAEIVALALLYLKFTMSAAYEWGVEQWAGTYFPRNSVFEVDLRMVNLFQEFCMKFWKIHNLQVQFTK